LETKSPSVESGFLSLILVFTVAGAVKRQGCVEERPTKKMCCMQQPAESAEHVDHVLLDHDYIVAVHSDQVSPQWEQKVKISRNVSIN